MNCEDCLYYEKCDGYRVFDISTNRSEDCDDFKDKSRFVELPCQVGDIVYGVISGGYDVKTPYIATAEVKSIEAVKGGLIIETYRSKEDNTRLSFGEIGKWVFLSREEAEKKLEERKRKV